MANSSGGLFRPRNVLGAALILGIFVGSYFTPGWFGTGGTGSGKGEKTGNQTVSNPERVGSTSGRDDTQANNSLPQKIEPQKTPAVPKVVKVVIDEHRYLLKDDTKEIPIDLPALIELIKQAPGDDDSVKVRVYQKSTARAKAEEDLKAQLSNASIPDAAVIWVPAPIDK